MNRLAKFRDEQAKIHQQMNALLEEIGGNEPSEQQQGDYDALDVRFDELQASIDREERSMEREKKLKRITVDRDAEPEPKEIAQAQAKEQRWDNMGDMLLAVARAYGPTRHIDQRLIGAAAGMGEGIASEGGFLVQTDFSQELLKEVFDGGKILPRVRRIPISASSNGLKINGINQTSRADGSRWGGVQSYWLNEAGTLSDTRPDFRQIELELKKLIGLCYATDELLQDSAALESVISQAFAEEFTFKIEDAIVNGTGAGQPLGIMSAACKVQVSKETGQAATTIVAENVEKMYSRMHARSISNAVWLINQNCWPQLFQLSHAVGTGGVPMFVPGGGLSQAPFGTLLGRPIIPVEYCQSLGTAGDIIFADFSQYLMIDKGSLRSDSSIHVRFLYDESTFRFVYRCDGQPTWASVLTPYKGGSSYTQSPFIYLQTRS